MVNIKMIVCQKLNQINAVMCACVYIEEIFSFEFLGDRKDIFLRYYMHNDVFNYFYLKYTFRGYFGEYVNIYACISVCVCVYVCAYGADEERVGWGG